MATLNAIRRWALREQMSIREISRRTGLARNTVKKYLRFEETEPTYAKRVSPSKLDPYAEKLSTWIGIEVTKSRKQRRNLKQIYTLTPSAQAAFPATWVMNRPVQVEPALSIVTGTPGAAMRWVFTTLETHIAESKRRKVA